MAVAREVLEHRHPRLGTDASDEGLASTWNDDVDEVIHFEKRTDGLAVGGIDQLHAVGRQARGGDRPPHALHDPAAGMRRLLAAAKDDGIASREGHRRRIGRDIGPRLVDEKYHTQRHPDLADHQSARLPRFLDHLAHRIGQQRHRLDTRGDPLHPLGIEREPVDGGGRQAEAGGGGEVEFVGRKNLGDVSPDGGGGGPQAGGLLVARHAGKIDGRPTCPLGNRAAVRLQGGGIAGGCGRGGQRGHREFSVRRAGDL